MKQGISLPQIPKKLLDTNKDLYDYLFGLQQALLAKQTDDYGAVDKTSTDIATLTSGKVNLTGNETIAGIKTFSSNPVISNEAPAITFADTTDSAYDFRIRAEGNVLYLDIDTGSDGTFETSNPIASVYTGSSYTNTDYPIGTPLSVISGSATNRNSSNAIKYATANNTQFVQSSGTGVSLSGTWRTRARVFDSDIYQRTE